MWGTLICISLMINDFEHLFVCLMDIFMYYLEKVFFSSLPFFLLIQFVLFMLSCMYSLLIHYWIFLLQWLLLCAKARFVIVQIVYLCFCSLCYRDISKNIPKTNVKCLSFLLGVLCFQVLHWRLLSTSDLFLYVIWESSSVWFFCM